MSLHYEVVFTCFLRDGTPEPVLEALRWHTGASEERPPHLDEDEHPYQLLAPDPDSRLPGGEFASLRYQSLGSQDAWGLFTRNLWLDDDIGELTTVMDLLAPHVEGSGYAGYLREEYDTAVSVLTFDEGARSPATG
ncbi:hypothetical protein ACFYW1_33345 [Streptomyces sp. NPDC002669]|uniref:hypothetical protein n=1 Tax=Streptomyces sp. NPDC002669 TaxID=3364658 RepID=UPI00367719BB